MECIFKNDTLLIDCDTLAIKYIEVTTIIVSFL